jgi:5-methylcytosine-specific restriction protein A
MRRDMGLCQQCRAQGFTIPGEEVDHRVPLYKGGEETDENRWLLCPPCHATKTKADMGYTLKGCDASGVPVDPGHHWHDEDEEEKT